ncbi:MAG: site-2 protease family protein [Chloroflexi bacterium]|jgi:Zn-dependent protease|nr:site-2 protease family protein [Chloroflexota bacterium]
MLNLNPATLIARLITLVIALTVHEFSHAYFATRFGDDTPRRAGRLTLNPLAHLDPIGSLMLILVGFGWAKPVPINPYVIRQNNKAGVMITSIAGPLSNLALALLAAIPLRLGLFPTTYQVSGIMPTPGYFLIEFIYTNVALFLFNMLPLAPLDGEKVLEFLLPRSWQGVLQGIRQYGPFILLGLVFLGPYIGFDFFGVVIRRPLMAIVGFLIGS